MRKKFSLLVLSFAFVAIFAATTIVILDEDRSSDKVATSQAVPKSISSPATPPTFGGQEVEEPVPHELSIDEKMLRYVDAGYVNKEFLDYAEMGDRDARFQERFFVLRRHNAAGTETCSKYSIE